jgi:hypothetical protein
MRGHYFDQSAAPAIAGSSQETGRCTFLPDSSDLPEVALGNHEEDNYVERFLCL